MIEPGELKFDNQERTVNVNGNPFPMNMIRGSTTFINKYMKKWKKRRQCLSKDRVQPPLELSFLQVLL
jgi:hypothetical protein